MNTPITVICHDPMSIAERQTAISHIPAFHFVTHVTGVDPMDSLFGLTICDFFYRFLFDQQTTSAMIR